MTLELTREFLGWCVLIKFGLLLYWSLMLMFARNWVYRMHSRFLPVDVDRFNAIHYAGIAFYKIGIFVFLFVPWIVLHIMG